MTSEVKIKNQSPSIELDQFEPILTWKRWLMLALFSTFSMLNAFQWLHINIVAPSSILFWNGSLPDDQGGKEVAIAWLSMIYMLVYIPMIVPATWLLNKYGLRVSIVLGAGLNALGAWIKCLSIEMSQPYGISTIAAASSFPILMFGQFFCALSQVFILGIPAQLAATWFGRSELALATSIGVFGNQVGCALGFGLPPLMVPTVTGSAGVDEFGLLRRGFRIMFYGGAAIMTLEFILVSMFFKEEPEVAPSLAQHKRLMQRRSKMLGEKQVGGDFDDSSGIDVSVLTLEEADLLHQSYFRQVLHTFKCPSFVLLIICYGVNTGVYYEIGTLLSVILAEFFPAEQVAIGWVGFSMVIAGLVGSLVAGFALERTGHYRRVLIIFYMLSVLSWGAFMASLYSPSIVAVFFTMISLGFFQSGFLPLGFEYAAEITYPIDEGLTSGIINTGAHIFGVILTYVAADLHNLYHALPTNIFILVCMTVAAIPACFMKDDLKRQRAQQMISIEVEPKSLDEESNTYEGN